MRAAWYGPEDSGPWYVTDHALERFVERHGKATGCRSLHEAMMFLADEALAAKPTSEPGSDGVVELVGRRPWRIRYVVGPPPVHIIERHGVGAKKALVTVKSR